MVLDRVISQEKEIKGLQIGKEDVKLSPFVDDTFYIENHKEPTKIGINEFSKVVEYKTNIQILGLGV